MCLWQGSIVSNVQIPLFTLLTNVRCVTGKIPLLPIRNASGCKEKECLPAAVSLPVCEPLPVWLPELLP